MSSRLKLVALGVIIISAIIVLLALGTWQVVRLQQAGRDDAYREARVNAAPITWSSSANLAPADVDFHRVTISGKWDNAHTLVLTNRARYDLLGKDVVTPLLPDDGGPAILVNRGWFPDADREQTLAKLAAEDRATVQGLAVLPSKIEPGRQTSTGDWTRVDPDTMGRGLPYPLQGWQLLQGRRTTLADSTSAPPSLPVQLWVAEGPALPHLDYALTWYSLAAILIAVVAIRARQLRAEAAAARH